MKQAKRMIGLLLAVWLTISTITAQKPGSAQRAGAKNSPDEIFAPKSGNRRTAAKSSRLAQFRKTCATDFGTQRLFVEYGAVFAADPGRLRLPDGCFFRDEREVRRFQNQAGAARLTIGTTVVTLQKNALQALTAARQAAQQAGFDITPRMADSAGRSYDDTLRLWREKVEQGLRHYVGRKKLAAREAETIRALAADRQIREILRLEERGMLFGKGFGKSILQSVAPPGGSQHNLLAALDVKEHDRPEVRAILAAHGWFQTVLRDEPHFTFLGVGESELPARGLKRVTLGGRVYWVVRDGFAARAGGSDETPKPSKTEVRPAEPTANNGLTRERIVKTAKTEPRAARTETRPNAARTVSRPSIVRPSSEVSIKALSLPKDSIPATVSRGILLPVTIERLLTELTQKYYNRTGRKLHITSGYRPPSRQARAMYDNLVNYGVGYVVGQYSQKGAVWEIIRAFQQNEGDREAALAAMKAVIEAQMKRGVKISDHLLEKAFDIRSRGPEAANFAILCEIVYSMKGRCKREADHFHVEF